jgi:hypothetical protein
LLGVAALALAGCSSTGGGGGGGSDPTLHGYAPTYYRDGTSLAQAREAGIEGLMVGPNGAGTAKLTTTGDALTVEIEGETYTFQKLDSGPSTSPAGLEYASTTYEGEYSQFGVNLVDGEYSGMGVLYDPTETSPVRLFVTGQETRHMPNQTAIYTGDWIFSDYADREDDGGIFDATADFDARTIDYSVAGDGFVGSGQGQIQGSQFEGDIAFDGSTTGSGTMSGAFFGPAADEVGGISSGLLDGGEYQAVFHGRQE